MNLSIYNPTLGPATYTLHHLLSICTYLSIIPWAYKPSTYTYTYLSIYIYWTIYNNKIESSSLFVNKVNNLESQ